MERLLHGLDLAFCLAKVSLDVPAKIFFLLDVPWHTPLSVVTMFVVTTAHCNSSSVFIVHAGWQDMLLESAVLDEFCIKTTISGMVYLLKEDTIEIGRNRSSVLLEIDRNGCILSHGICADTACCKKK